MENEYRPEGASSATEDFALPNPPVQEEFDISHFDFTIHDPGEDLSPAPEPQPEAPAAPKADPAPSPAPAAAPKRSRDPKVPDEARARFGLPDFAAMDRQALRRKGRRYLRYALRPVELYENIGGSLWWLFLTGGSLFGGLFYLSVGMDWAHADLISAGRMWAFVLTGLLVGGTATLAFALGTALTARFCREDAVDPYRMISAAAGAAVCPTALLGVGILLGIFGLSVSMSFGMMALLWWIFSLMEVLRDLMGNRFVPILTWILLWSFSLFCLISVTFSLK